MPTNITVTMDTLGSHGNNDSEVSWYIVVASVLCTVAMVAIVTVLVYRFFHKRSGPLWITKFYHQDQYSTMKNDDAKDDQFIIGFSNPMANSKDDTDSSVKPLAYRPLDEDKEPNDKDQYLLQYKFLFPREKLTYGAEIGSGWFGKVFKGEATRIVPGLRKTKVIIKKLCEDSTSEQRKRFIDEISMFKSLNHENVLEVLGVATEQQPYLAVFEYNPLGNLKEYLLSHQNEALSTKKGLNPLKISIDIGSGLEFLHSKGFYHSDLATRNCIVNSDLSVKIGDYGISRDLYQRDYYNDPKSNSGESLPIRWLDPESVCRDKDSGVSVKSIEEKENVWSFGVVLWEIVEYGRQPYAELTDDEVLQTVIVDRLYQLPEPRDTGILASQLYDMMKWCWIDSSRRPSVKEMVVFLKGLSENLSDLLAESESEEQQPSTSTHEYRQPVAVVRPLQHKETIAKETEETEDDIHKATTSDRLSKSELSFGECENLQHNDVQVTAICDELEDVPVTVINSESSQENELKRKDILNEDPNIEWTKPVTYIGGPSDGITEYEQTLTQGTQDEITPSCPESQIIEVKYSGGEPSVIIEDCPSGYVVLPGETLRRKSSIRKANAQSKGNTVHFPANILDLRVVHRYYPEEEENEEEDGGESEQESSPSSSNFTFELHDQGERISLHDEGSPVDDDTEMGSALILDRPTSPVEKRVRKATRRKQLKRNADEWLFSIDQEH